MFSAAIGNRRENKVSSNMNVSIKIRDDKDREIHKSRPTEVLPPIIRRGLRFSGYLTSASDQDGIGFLLRRYALHILRMVVVVQSALVSIFCWKTWGQGMRIAYLQECAFEIMTFTYALNFFYSKTNSQEVMRLSQPILFDIDENEGDLPALKLSEDASGIVGREDAANYRLAVSVMRLIDVECFTYALKPIFRMLLHWFGLKPIDGTALPLICFNPFVQPLTPDISKISHLLAITLPQLFYLYDTTMGVEGAHMALFFCVGNVVTDMKVLKQELDEMQVLLQHKLNTRSLDVEEDDVNDWKDLDRVLRQICCHHQAVFRRIKAINQVFTFPIIIMNATIGFFICVGVYCLVNAGDLSPMISHCVITLIGTIFCHIFCENGQRIETEGENLRMALYDCYVVGSQHMPLWYYRSISFMIQRHDRPPCISPFQVFCLNRTSLKVIMQGAMSYFNILNNLSK